MPKDSINIIRHKKKIDENKDGRTAPSPISLLFSYKQKIVSLFFMFLIVKVYHGEG